MLAYNVMFFKAIRWWDGKLSRRPFVWHRTRRPLFKARLFWRNHTRWRLKSITVPWMKNNFTIRLKRLTLCTTLSACTLSPCLAQTARPLNLGQDGMLTDSMLRLQTPRYQVVSAKDNIKLHWTGKTFSPPKGCEGDRHLVTSSLEKVDSKLFTHPLSIIIKDIEVSNNGGGQEQMTILAVKSADKG